MVPLVQVAVLGTVEVGQDEDRLELRVVLVRKLAYAVGGHARGGVDVLQGEWGRVRRRETMSEIEIRIMRRNAHKNWSLSVVINIAATVTA